MPPIDSDTLIMNAIQRRPLSCLISCGQSILAAKPVALVGEVKNTVVIASDFAVNQLQVTKGRTRLIGLSRLSQMATRLALCSSRLWRQYQGSGLSKADRLRTEFF